MNFLPHDYSFESEKNGTVHVHEWLWWVEVYAGGFEQSGPYVIELWKRALKKMWRWKRVRLVLVIGLCAGDNVRLVQRRYRKAKIIVVEWDHGMIDMALALKRFKQKNVEIVHSDVRDALPTLTGQFDIILSDAFYGDRPDVGAEDARVGEALKRILAPGGSYILNASRTPGAIDYISQYLKLKKQWRFRDNTVALFTH